MKKYKPGQVSAVLFSKTKPSDENNPLAQLFARPPQVAVPETDAHKAVVAQEVKKSKKSKKRSQAQDIPPQSEEQSPSKLKKEEKDTANSAQAESVEEEKKKKKKKNKNKKDEQPGETTDSAPIPAPTLKAVAQGKEDLNGTIGSNSPKKRKLDRVKDDEDEKVKRPRRDRQRDKTNDKRTIFVGNCPLSADQKKIKQIFREYGQVETVRIRCAPAADPNLPRRAIVITKNFHEQCSSYVAYVVFKEEEAAKKALEKNGFLLDNLHLRVDLASSAKKHDKKRSVFVGNLPFSIDEESIRSHFEDCGDIANIRIIRDRQTSLGKGFCYVQFESKDSVSLAMKLNGSELQGRSLRVMACVSKPKDKDSDKKQGKNTKIKEKPRVKKPSFAPSNASGSSFKALLKTKKEKRMRKMKKKKENAKKSDGLQAIFGDTQASQRKTVKKKGPAKAGVKGKGVAGKKGFKSRPSKKSGQKRESSFKGKGKKGRS